MEKLLTSWKEIAGYFGKSVRTVQRWEREYQLPVRRPKTNETNIVLASVKELMDWTNRRTGANGAGELTQLKRRVAELEEELRHLKLELEGTPTRARLAARGSSLELLKPRKSEIAS